GRPHRCSRCFLPDTCRLQHLRQLGHLQLGFRGRSRFNRL
ncbi:MAG: hypothetical protein, partial [Olavius algarvensis Gamma 1 endosymbiont]